VSTTLPAVAVDGVSKSFRLPHERVHTLKERALHPLRRSGTDELRALRDVSFAVQHGEFFGIVGRNGSGKSTLLKCLAGIYATDAGDIYVNGRLSTFIELGVGFNPDLPARENVMINATMLGLSPREARRRFDEVIDFAELHDFIDLKLKNYSSGMMVRLAFAVMIQVDASILLIDEVLAVGDASFQQKCFDEFGRIRDEGRTVLLVTHDMAAVRRFCDRAMLLEHGRIVEEGDPSRIGNRYLELNFSEDARDEEPAVRDPDAEERYGDRRAEVLEGWFEDAAGRRATLLHTGEPCGFAARVRFHEDVVDPLFGVNLLNGDRVPVLSASNILAAPHAGRFAAGEEAVFRIRFTNVFSAGRLFATPAVAQSGSGFKWLDRRERLASVVVSSTRETDAVTDLDYDFALERAEAHEHA
jgi:ABC-type polysaccharide/polyol phosphate transport system ATPase subunit